MMLFIDGVLQTEVIEFYRAVIHYTRLSLLLDGIWIRPGFFFQLCLVVIVLDLGHLGGIAIHCWSIFPKAWHRAWSRFHRRRWLRAKLLNDTMENCRTLLNLLQLRSRPCQFAAPIVEARSRWATATLQNAAGRIGRQRELARTGVLLDRADAVDVQQVIEVVPVVAAGVNTHPCVRPT
jgi:hypothetical protein